MNRQAFLLPVLIGLLQFSGWQTLAAQQRVEDEQKAGRTHFREGPEPNEIGRVELSEKQAKNANLDVEVAGPAKINVTHQLSGKITFNEDTVANVTARYPGVVKAVYKGLGDRVQKSEALALIESSDSLRNYQVNSEISGTIIKKEVTIEAAETGSGYPD